MSEDAGPPAAFWALSRAMAAELRRRVVRASLIAAVPGVLVVFGLGVLLIIDDVREDLLAAFLAFFIVYGPVLAWSLWHAT